MVSIYFSGRELIKMALKIEENGWSFYHEALKGLKDEGLKELFTYLAEQELRHIEDFKNLYNLIKEEKVKGIYDLTYDEEVSMYLNALAGSKVFTDPAEGFRRARVLKGEMEAIEVAIGFEKDSLLFYYEMSRLIRDEEREVVERLIGQEKEHLRKLNELKRGDTPFNQL